MEPHEKLEMELAMDQMLKALPAMLDIYPIVARLTREYFNQLVKEGFTEEQALKIVSEQGVKARMSD